MKDLSALSPKEWLDHYRKLHNYKPIPTAEDHDFLRVIRKRFKKSADRIIGKYGHLTQSQWEDLLIERILVAIGMTNEEKEKIGDVHFGVFPTFDIRGRKEKTDRGDTIVLLHKGLISTVWAWSMLYALRLQGDDFNKLMSDTMASANFFAGIGRIWNAELLHVELDNPIPFELTEDSWAMVTVLIDSCLAYILGHEIGHLLEGHRGYTGDQIADYKMEYKADQWGLKFCTRYILFVNAAAPINLSRAMLLGPYLALSLIVTITDHKGHHHPSASMRLNRLRKEFKGTFKETLGKEEFQNFKRRMGSDCFKRIDRLGINLFELHKVYSRIISMLVAGARKAMSQPPSLD